MTVIATGNTVRVMQDPDSRVRGVPLMVRLTEEEEAMLEALVKDGRTNKSQWIRAHIAREYKKIAPAPKRSKAK